MLLHCGTERLRYCRLYFASGAFVGVHVTCQTSGVAKSAMAYQTLRTISTLGGCFFFADGPAGVSVDDRLTVLVGVEFFAALHDRKAELPTKVAVVSKLTWSSIFPHAPQWRAFGSAWWLH